MPSNRLSNEKLLEVLEEKFDKKFDALVELVTQLESSSTSPSPVPQQWRYPPQPMGGMSDNPVKQAEDHHPLKSPAECMGGMKVDYHNDPLATWEKRLDALRNQVSNLETELRHQRMQPQESPWGDRPVHHQMMPSSNGLENFMLAKEVEQLKGENKRYQTMVENQALVISEQAKRIEELENDIPINATTPNEPGGFWFTHEKEWKPSTNSMDTGCIKCTRGSHRVTDIGFSVVTNMDFTAIIFHDGGVPVYQSPSSYGPHSRMTVKVKEMRIKGGKHVDAYVSSNVETYAQGPDRLKLEAAIINIATNVLHMKALVLRSIYDVGSE